MNENISYKDFAPTPTDSRDSLQENANSRESILKDIEKLEAKKEALKENKNNFSSFVTDLELLKLEYKFYKKKWKEDKELEEKIIDEMQFAQIFQYLLTHTVEKVIDNKDAKNEIIFIGQMHASMDNSDKNFQSVINSQKYIEIFTKYFTENSRFLGMENIQNSADSIISENKYQIENALINYYFDKWIFNSEGSFNSTVLQKEFKEYFWKNKYLELNDNDYFKIWEETVFLHNFNSIETYLLIKFCVTKIPTESLKNILLYEWKNMDNSIYKIPLESPEEFLQKRDKTNEIINSNIISFQNEFKTYLPNEYANLVFEVDRIDLYAQKFHTMNEKIAYFLQPYQKYIEKIPENERWNLNKYLKNIKNNYIIFLQYAFTLREDYTLNLISNVWEHWIKIPIKYGNAHRQTFADRIQKWNSENPDKQFSYSTIDLENPPELIRSIPN